MNIAFIGCGYVAEFYAKTLGSHPELKLVGAFDRNRQNLDAFSRRWPSRGYSSFEELLADREVELVLNLTNPRSHAEVTRRSLEAGKHVYSEKPLAMSAVEALELAELAKRNGLCLGSAPCSVLSETAQTLWKAIRDRAVGKVRLVYANFDDGMIAPNMSPWTWRNESGVAWPAKDEFEVGSTFEHAGYVLTWLAAFFGPALRVTSFASCQIPDKGIQVDAMAPDFSVGCIEFAGGVVARVTCGLVAPEDRSMTVIGDDGVLFVGNLRDDSAPVMLRPAKLARWQSAIVRRLGLLGNKTLFQRRYPAVPVPRGGIVSPSKPVDFMRGPAEMAAAIREKRQSRLSGAFSAHIVEIVEALQYPERFGHHRELTTTFEAMEPLHGGTQ